MATKTNLILGTILAISTLLQPAARADSCPVNDGPEISIDSARSAQVSQGPSIHIDAGNSLNVRLEANGEASIDIDSVRVRYSGLDITDQIREAVGELTPAIEVPGDLLPAGRHRIAILVRDDAGRRAVIKFTLRVSGRDTSAACNDAIVARNAAATTESQT